MKRLGTVLGAVLLVTALAYPAFAWGPCGGKGPVGYGAGPGSCWQGGAGNANLTDEQQTKLDELNQKFYNETNDLRNRIWTKNRELNTAMRSANPNVEQAKALQKELSDLKGQMAQKRLEYDIEANKIVPEGANTSGRGYGRGPGAGGYGPCWN